MTDPSYNRGQDPHHQQYRPQHGYPTQSGYPQQPQGYQQQPGHSQQPQEPQRQTPEINLGRLWAGGLGTALVVALVIVVGIMLIRGILNIAILAPEGAGTYGTVSTTSYALGGAAVALAATGLLALLLAFMPSPLQFFRWIIGLITALAVLLPFTLVADLGPKIATSALNLIIGLCIMTLLGSVGSSAISRRQ
ncbi:MAG: hypothetical protein GX610_13030 [Rhodococcus sp.]|nr:hypothetical protein [Rhodococcus sp. (in: high G+C Gram-positive bacteria)]